MLVNILQRMLVHNLIISASGALYEILNNTPAVLTESNEGSGSSRVTSITKPNNVKGSLVHLVSHQ